MGESPLRTARRWLARYRADGLATLGRQVRADRGERRLPAELVTFIEGLYLRKAPPSIATIHRLACGLPVTRGWPEPGYRTVLNIAKALEPSLVALAQEGDKAYREAFDLIYRPEAGRPNEMWQGDHTELDIVVVDPPGPSARPWLTVKLSSTTTAEPYRVTLSTVSAADGRRVADRWHLRTELPSQSCEAVAMLWPGPT